MKKLFALCLFAIGLFLFSCQKEITEKEKAHTLPPRAEPEMQGTPTTKLDYFKLLAEKFLTTAKYSVEFKEWVYKECHAENYGDYYVRVRELLDQNVEKDYEFWGIEEVDYIRNILDEIRNIDSTNDEDFTDPIVFIPFVEDINLDSLLNECPTAIPDAVISMEYNPATAFCTGYTLDDGDGLIDFASDIDEEYAWSHDLWVFGQEEVFNDDLIGNRSTNTPFNSASTNRVNGRAEYGGIIQVTDMKELEGWVNGKLEFRYFVFSASGTRIKDRKFSQVKRKHFKDWQWYDFNDFIANWNTSNIGNFMVEGWIEMDGGKTQTLSMSIPAACQGCPSTTVGVSIQKNDDEMGQAIVQFTDPVQPTDATATIYQISYANFKRKH